MPVAPSTRRGFVLGSSALLASLMLPASLRTPRAAAAAAPAFGDAAYWAFADRMQAVLDPFWDGDSYRPHRSMLNANCCSRMPRRRWPGTPGPARAATTGRGRWSTGSATGRRGLARSRSARRATPRAGRTG